MYNIFYNNRLSNNNEISENIIIILSVFGNVTDWKG